MANMMSVFLHQSQARTEQEAQKMLTDAEKKGDGYIGGRVLPDRSNKRRWLVQTYYEATGDKPPQGMARLTIPAGAENLKRYGITVH